MPTGSIVFVGGDLRTLAAADCLQNLNVDTQVFGFQPHLVPEGIQVVENLEAVLPHTRALVLPVPGPADDGVVIAETGEMVRIDRSFLSDLSETSCVVVGRAGSFLSREAAAADIEVHELLDRDDFALHNAVPTAEGAIWEAMKRSDVTVAGSNTHVVGYGRCGKVLANHLQGLNSTVTVVSQTSEKRAEAAALGFQDQPLEYWDDLVGQADFIFNTVPAQLVDAAMLARTRDSVVIIDIASAPGGVDFQAAHDLGREAVLTPGLPGKQAPRTAGIAIARVIRELLQF